MATLRYFWHGFIQRGKRFMYFQYNRSLIYHLLLNVWKVSYTISAPIFVDVPYWPPYSTESSSPVLYRVPRSEFFTGEEIVIAYTHNGWVRWMFQNLPLPAAQEVRDSSGVTPCTVMKNVGVLYHQWMIQISSNVEYRHRHQSVLPKGRSFTANAETMLSVLLGINRCGSFLLLSALYSLFSIWKDLKKKNPRGTNVEVRRVCLANWAVRTSSKFTTGVKYQFH